MAATVLQAVIQRFDASTAGVLTSTSGKLHLNEVPEDKSLPWAVLMHGGARMAARESGVVTGFQWLASSDACETCLNLDGKQVKEGEPYLITSGKPPYNVIWHPPAHPHCFCDETEIIGEWSLAA